MMDSPVGQTGDLHAHYATPPPGEPMSRIAQLRWLAIGTALVAGALFLLPALASRGRPVGGEPAESGAFTPTDQQWAALRIEQVRATTVSPTIITEGRIALSDDLSTPVFSPFSGHVVHVLAHAGDVVAAGAPLFTVASPELAQARNDLVVALAGIKTAHAQLNVASANAKRQEKLFAAHGAAERDYQQSQADLANAEGATRGAEIALAAVRGRMQVLGLSARDIDAAETTGDLEHASAEAIVRSPVAGTIVQRAVNPGENIVSNEVSAGAANALYVIGDTRRLWMVADAREMDALAFHAGAPVTVTVPALPGHRFDARISFVAPGIDPATHRLTIRADLDNSGGLLRPEMLAKVVVESGVPRAGVTVPETAVVYEGADAHLFVADPAHKTLALRNITVGDVSGGQVEVRQGLTPGESIVTSGAVFIDRVLASD